jgi:hypothetical protein
MELHLWGRENESDGPVLTAHGFFASHAGYIVVYVESSTTDTTYVRVIYSSHDVNCDKMIPVGKWGIATFPVLPLTSVEVRVGNNNVFYSATETLTIKYYYLPP